MEENQEETQEPPEAEALDIEFLPLVILHKIHRNLKSSQVELVPQNYYVRESNPESEPEMEGEMEPEIVPPQVVYAPPLPALKERKNWWDFYHPAYAFNNPRIRSRIETLMTSRIVQVNDRKYMVRLQERIRENFLACSVKRIRERAADEVEREKRLLLSGKIPYEDAPAELKNHPVCRINYLAQRVIRNKRAKMKKIDKTDPYRTPLKRIRHMEKILKETFLDHEAEKNLDSSQVSSVCETDAPTEKDVELGLMFSKKDYENLRFEDPLVKLLREIDGVMDMYQLADNIVGATKVEVGSSKKPSGSPSSVVRQV